MYVCTCRVPAVEAACRPIPAPVRTSCRFVMAVLNHSSCAAKTDAYSSGAGGAPPPPPPVVALPGRAAVPKKEGPCPYSDGLGPAALKGAVMRATASGSSTDNRPTPPAGDGSARGAPAGGLLSRETEWLGYTVPGDGCASAGAGDGAAASGTRAGAGAAAGVGGASAAGSSAASFA